MLDLALAEIAQAKGDQVALNGLAPRLADLKEGGTPPFERRRYAAIMGAS